MSNRNPSKEATTIAARLIRQKALLHARNMEIVRGQRTEKRVVVLGSDDSDEAPRRPLSLNEKLARRRENLRAKQLTKAQGKRVVVQESSEEDEDWTPELDNFVADEEVENDDESQEYDSDDDGPGEMDAYQEGEIASYGQHNVRDEEGGDDNAMEVGEAGEAADTSDEESMHPISTSPKKKKKKNKEKKNPTKTRLTAAEKEDVNILRSMVFAGTRYPHPDTMKRLGISRDVEFLIESCGLINLMFNPYDSYEKETCQFLATLEVEDFSDDEKIAAHGGELGCVFFKIWGQEYSLTFTQLRKIYKMKPGNMFTPAFVDGELQRVWDMIAGTGIYSSSRAKSSWIRSPVLRYFHKTLACTMYARKSTGTLQDGELQILDTAIRSQVDFTPDGLPILGDQENACFVGVLLNHLLSYKDWARKMQRMGVTGVLSIGGIVTPLLLAVGAEIRSPPVAHKWIDIPFLLKSQMIQVEKGTGRLLYSFTHPVTAERAKIVLPCPQFTSIMMGRNIDFIPPLAALFGAPPQDSPPCAPSPVAAHVEQTPAGEMDDEPYRAEQFYFEEYEAPPRAYHVREVNQRVNLLQRLNKYQDKTIKKLRGAVKEMGKQLKDLQAKFSPTTRAQELSPALRRTGSTNVQPRRTILPEPPRSSSYEPRDRPHLTATYQRRRTSVSGARAAPLDHHTSSRQATRAAPLDHHTSSRQATRAELLDHHTSSGGRARLSQPDGTSSRTLSRSDALTQLMDYQSSSSERTGDNQHENLHYTGYTRESMDDSVTSSFRF